MMKSLSGQGLLVCLERGVFPEPELIASLVSSKLEHPSRPPGGDQFPDFFSYIFVVVVVLLW